MYILVFVNLKLLFIISITYTNFFLSHTSKFFITCFIEIRMFIKLYKISFICGKFIVYYFNKWRQHFYSLKCGHSIHLGHSFVTFNCNQINDQLVFLVLVYYIMLCFVNGVKVILHSYLRRKARFLACYLTTHL